MENGQQTFISQDFPSYESVVKHFIENYDEPIHPKVPHFEKRLEGYLVNISSSLRAIERSNHEILWSNKTKSFQPLKQYSRGGKKFNRIDYYSSPFKRYAFNEK